MWKPYPGGQTEFLSRSEFEVLYGGRAGPGKTDCMVAGMSEDTRFPKYRGLILRRTFPQLQEIIDRCFSLYPQMGATYRATEHRWYWPCGATVQLGHMQHELDKYNYQGKEYQKVGFDEVTQFTETQYKYMFSRVRTTDPRITTQILSTTNPGGIGHNWVKERFISLGENKVFLDPDTGLSRIFIPGRREDNPALFENDPGYITRLESLPEIERLRLMDGVWDAFEGQVFSELTQRVHGIDPFDVPPEWPKTCVLDWGYAKPFSVGWYAVDYDSVIYRYRGWYGCKEDAQDTGLRMPAYEVARGILERETEVVKTRIADPSIWHTKPKFRHLESRGPTIQDDMAEAGVFFLKADNDRIQGKMQVHKRLTVEEDVDKKTGEILGSHPQIQIFNDQPDFWRCMTQMQEDPRNPEDVDTKQEDHIYDDFRYMCMSQPLIPKRIEKAPRGTFQSERKRYINAKNYARTHGVSMQVAYSRVR